MADRTSIEWTEATWNPVTGCTEVSPGCDHCYAETFADRFRGTPGHYFEAGFDVVLRPDKLDLPLRWKRPRKVFVNSMSDLFHDAVSDEYIARVFAVMAAAPQHTFQVLTKRHGRMRSLLSSDRFQDLIGQAQVDDPRLTRAGWTVEWPLPNVWVGVSTENQQWADIRIPALLATPAAVRWISAEPLLGPIDLTRVAPTQLRTPDGWSGSCWTNALAPTWGSGRPAIDWVVVGGESGRGARPMHPGWARSLRDQCAAAGIAFLFKQWGEWAPAPWKVPVESEAAGATHAIAPWGHVNELHHKPWSAERSPQEPKPHAGIRRVGKKAAGRELDGVTHGGFPGAVAL